MAFTSGAARRLLAWTGIGVGLAVAAGLAGCGSQEKPAAQTSQFRPADEASAPVATQPPDAEVKPANRGEGIGRIASESSTPGPAPAATAVAAATAPSSPARAAATPNLPAATGDIQQLTATIDALAHRQPQGNTREERLQDFVNTQNQRLTACRQVLALNPDGATKRNVVKVIIEIFGVFDQLKIPGAKTQMADLMKSLVADSDPETARLGRHMLFDAKLAQIASQPQPDGKAIVTEVKNLLDAEKAGVTEETLSLAAQGAQFLLQSGDKDNAVAVLKTLAETAGKSSDLGDRAGRYAAQAKLAEADLEALLTNVLTEQPEADAKLLQTLKQLLAELPPSRDVFANLQQVAVILEATGHLETANKCLDLIDTAFQSSQDEKLRQAVAHSLAGARKRMSLVGQPFAVEGVLIDGKPFDWSSYQGKVVLVDFWATWCGPCREELPNVIRNYEQFHALGFDVVGVNLDTNLSELKQFFSVQDLPWATVTSQVVLEGKAAEDFSQLPMAAKCGVDAIPFLVLVGKDGKVDSLHVRGNKLKARLTQLLGEPQGSDVPADPTTPAAPASKPAAESKTGAWLPPVGASRVSLLIAQALLAADPPPVFDDPAINPYRAKPGLSASQLVETIQKMLDKPQTIQRRAGFGEAIVDACDRVLAADPSAKETEGLFAVETKLTTLHHEACDGKEAADKQLMAFVEQLSSDQRPRIAQQVAFFKLERKAIDAAQAPLDEVPALLAQLQEYFSNEKLSARHLRLASSTVALVNRLEDGDQREKHFAQFGNLFAKSGDKDLARYGKKLAKKPAGQDSDLVGKPLELAGTTAGGKAFTWQSYRGKVVLVDFWATWCGPCRREMPHVQAFYEQHRERGLTVVGVSLDQDQEALAAYLDENKIPWETLAGDETQELAEKYGVRAIPTLMLVDTEGKVAAVAHDLDTIASLAEKLLSR